MKLIDPVEHFTFRHVLWHWILGLTMILDGLSAVLTLGFFHSWCTPWWIEEGGNKLYQHQSAPRPRETGPEPGEALDAVKAQIAQQLGIDISDLEILSIRPMGIDQFSRPYDKEEWN